MSACKRCHAPILWALTTTGAKMPIDPKPHENGNVELTFGAGDPVAVVRGPDVPIAAGKAYVSHFVSCPAAGQFRRARQP